jgi:membrane protease YdiL (CAAX protease family)
VKLDRRPSSWLLLAAGGALAALGLLFSPGILGSKLAIGALFPLSLVVGTAGGLLLLLAMATIVVVPRGDVASARVGYGSHSTILGLTLLAGLGSLGLVLPALIPALAAGRGALAQSFVLILSTLVLDAVLVAIVYFRVVRPGIITWDDMGLSAAKLRSAWQAAPAGAVGLFLVVAAVEIVMKALGVQQTQLESLQWLRTAPLWLFALVVVTAAGLVPIAEEIYFRGYVFRAYYDQKGPLQAYLFSAALFAVVHLNLQAFVPIFAVGLFLAFLYRHTGSILPGILAHAFNNAVAFAVLYFAAP